MSRVLTEPEVIQVLKNAVTEMQLDFSEATEETLLESLGMDSLDRLELVSILEDALSVRIPDETLKAIQTVGQLAACLIQLQISQLDQGG